jgi:hypothetical protein
MPNAVNLARSNHQQASVIGSDTLLPRFIGSFSNRGRNSSSRSYPYETSNGVFRCVIVVY